MVIVVLNNNGRERVEADIWEEDKTMKKSWGEERRGEHHHLLLPPPSTSLQPWYQLGDVIWGQSGQGGGGAGGAGGLYCSCLHFTINQ